MLKSGGAITTSLNHIKLLKATLIFIVIIPVEALRVAERRVEKILTNGLNRKENFRSSCPSRKEGIQRQL
jgi:hypothetical protein